MRNMSEEGMVSADINSHCYPQYHNANNEEEYSGEGEASLSQITARRAGNFLTQFMPGEEWYDRLFAEQDDQHCGKIRTSKLMEFIKIHVEIPNDNDYNRLEMMLDPVGNDILIDAETFRAKIITWESEQLQPEFANYSNADYSFSTSKENVYSCDAAKLNCKYETDISSESYQIDVFAVENDNSQLKYMNKRLESENSHLETQVSSLEESNNCYIAEVRKLTTKAEGLQRLLRESQHEITLLTCKIEEERYKLTSECTQLATERTDLDCQLKLVKKEHSVFLADYKKLEIQIEDLKRKNKKLEKEIIDLSSQCQTSDEKVEQATEENSQLRETLLAVFVSNEELRHRQRKLEEDMMKLYESKWLDEVDKQTYEQLEDDQQADSDEPFEVNSPIEFRLQSEIIFWDHGQNSLLDELRDSLSTSDDGSQFTSLLTSSGTFDMDIEDSAVIPYQNCCRLLEEPKSIHTEDKFRVSDGSKNRRTPKNAPNRPRRSSSRHYDYLPSGRHDAWYYRTCEFDRHPLKVNELDDQTGFLLTASTESIPDQISKELQMLRMHIAKSEAYLATLSRASKMPILQELLKHGKKGTTDMFDDLNYERNLHWAPHQNASLYHAKCLQKCYTYTAPSSSHSSTPQHCRIRSHSCPLLPSETSLITRSTQTEPTVTTPFTDLHLVSVTTASHHLESSTPCISTFVKAPIKSFDSSRLHFHNLPAISSTTINESSTSSDDTSPPVTLNLRNRTYSFAQAIAQAVDINGGLELGSGMVKSRGNADLTVSMVTTSTNTTLSSTSSDEDSDEFRVSHSPRKLSVLQEEEHEDSESVSKSPPSTLVTSMSSLVSTQRPLRTVPCTSEITSKPSVSVILYNQNMPGQELFPRQPPPYRPPPPPVGGRAYYSSENVSHVWNVSHRLTDQSSKSFDNLPTTLSPTTLLPTMPDTVACLRLRATPPPIRQFSDPFPHSSAGPSNLPYSDGQHLLPSEPPSHSVSAQHLDFHASPSSWHTTSAFCLGPQSAFFRSSSDPTPNPPEYQQPPIHSARQCSLSPQASSESEGAQPPSYDYLPIRSEQPANIEIPVPPKSDTTVAAPPEPKRKIGLNLKEPPKMVVTAEYHPCRQEKIDDDSDEDVEKNVLGRMGSRRRRRSSGSLVSSPAIQRAKAVDFDFDATEDLMFLPPEISPPKKDDSDYDVKHDILEGMTQATSCATRQSPSISEPVTTTIPSGASKSSSEAHDHKLRRRTADSSKTRLLMPELMENSETESAKNSGGSMESEAEPPTAPAVDEKAMVPPHPSGDGPFPSLPDSYLKKLELHSSCKERSDHLTDADIEIKFNSLCLAFKTDRFTLTNRLELHQRQRDLSEKNVDDEIVALKENLNVLSQICSDEETRNLVKNLHHHLEVLNQSTTRMLSRAEIYGAVQQEERTNKAIEVMLAYVDNLKRNHDKNLQDLEEYRRILTENNLLNEDSGEPEEGRRTTRTYSMSSVGAGKPNSRRRASIAALPRSADRMDGKTKFATFVANAASRNSTCNIDTRRCSQVYSLRPLTSQDNTANFEKSRKLSTDHQLTGNKIEQANNENACDGNESPRTPPLDANFKMPDKAVSNDFSAVDSKNNILPQKMGSFFIADNKSNCKLYPDSQLDSPNHQSLQSFSSLHDAQHSYLTDQTDQEEEDDECAGVSKLVTSTSTHCSPARIPVTFTFNPNKWVTCNEHWQNIFRYSFCGFLFLAALFSLLLTFMPLSTSAVECQTRTWYSVEELLQNRLNLRHTMRPPT